ncbi:MAG: hypothetical protein J5746_03830 [Victivallales bacterium]|nr:hypothetical protein [Victivallales bacterium]
MELSQLFCKKAELAAEAEKLAGKAYKYSKFGQPVPAEIEEQCRENNRLLEKLVFEIQRELDKPGSAHFSRENTWLWGGPTPYWGGSTKPDCAMDGARWFGFQNVVYVYGPVDEDAIALHSSARRLLCQLSEVSRSPGASRGTDAETAERLSKLSLQYQNIEGGIIDDLVGHYGRDLSLEGIAEIRNALKSHNDRLKLYSVVYASELESPKIKEIEPYVDAVNLWLGYKYQLNEMDYAIEKCRLVFPGKKIMLGVFLFDYFATQAPNTVDFLSFQLEKARAYLAQGKISDIVILGDREIENVPDEARFTRDFFQREFSFS